MTSRSTPPDSTIISAELTPDELRRFELLNNYMELLHSGDYASRSVLLEEHPEFLELLGCLESLDSLAIPFSEHSKNTVEQNSINSVAYNTTEPRPFGKYELQEEIGRGGMGVVHKARQVDLDRVVAIKLILSCQFASKEDIRRFYLEARSAGRLKHPNIVAIHEVGEINGQHYFAMDYIDGESLAAISHAAEFTAELAAECIAEIARAVDFLHQHGIVHRDLKPANILIDDDGQPFVTDFGLAKVFDSGDQQTQSGTILGTPSYMAPEQAAGQNSELGPTADIYSLGAILYELLTGRPPFKEENPLDTLVQVLEGEASRPSQLNRAVPRDLELICMKCLEKDAGSRYQSAAQLADDLQRFLRREAVDARPSGLLHKLRRWTRREPALVSRLSALLAAAGIVQIAFMFNAARDVSYHVTIMSIFGIWAALSFLFQWMLRRDKLEAVGRYCWSATDAALLTTLLITTGESSGTLLIGYPLLIVAAGMFFRVCLVWFTTAASILSYGALLWFQTRQNIPAHYPAIYTAVLALLGFMVAYQIYRVRVLSRYYQSRK